MFAMILYSSLSFTPRSLEIFFGIEKVRMSVSSSYLLQAEFESVWLTTTNSMSEFSYSNSFFKSSKLIPNCSYYS
jgi:hypothetical protein